MAQMELQQLEKTIATFFRLKMLHGDHGPDSMHGLCYQISKFGAPLREMKRFDEMNAIVHCIFARTSMHLE